VPVIGTFELSLECGAETGAGEEVAVRAFESVLDQLLRLLCVGDASVEFGDLALGAGTALIGNSQAASVWNKGGLSVEVTNSHSDLFLKNLLAIRAERRLGLTVFRPRGALRGEIGVNS
jgi:hypothetical protein